MVNKDAIDIPCDHRMDIIILADTTLFWSAIYNMCCFVRVGFMTRIFRSITVISATLALRVLQYHSFLNPKRRPTVFPASNIKASSLWVFRAPKMRHVQSFTLGIISSSRSEMEGFQAGGE